LKYPDGRQIRLGDRVKFGSDAVGRVVCCIDNGEYGGEHPEAQWGYLGKGVMIDFSGKYGLIHFTEPGEDIVLMA
jgi:hypothetical protein